MNLRFAIGDIVTVRACVRAVYDEKNVRSIQRDDKGFPQNGQIVGMKRLCTGSYHAGMRPAFDDAGEEAYFAATGHETVWLIRQGMLNTPIMARDADVELVASAVHVALGPFVKELRRKTKVMKVRHERASFYPWHMPFLHVNPYKWTERDRATQKQMMTGVPRDEKGRWKKENV